MGHDCVDGPFQGFEQIVLIGIVGPRCDLRFLLLDQQIPKIPLFHIFPHKQKSPTFVWPGIWFYRPVWLLPQPLSRGDGSKGKLAPDLEPIVIDGYPIKKCYQPIKPGQEKSFAVQEYPVSE